MAFPFSQLAPLPVPPQFCARCDKDREPFPSREKLAQSDSPVTNAAVDVPNLKNGKMSCCGRCQKAGKLVFYCSRYVAQLARVRRNNAEATLSPRSDCQVAHFKEHKVTCGMPFFHWQIPVARFRHICLLDKINADPDINDEGRAPPEYLYSPTPLEMASTSTADVIPICLPFGGLFRYISTTADMTGNRLSVNLMFSMLLDTVLASGGNEKRLLDQLSEEYGFDLAKALDEEVEPEEKDLIRAIGGEENMGALR